MKLICQNKKASFDYFLLDTYEAGIKLTGTEMMPTSWLEMVRFLL